MSPICGMPERSSKWPPGISAISLASRHGRRGQESDEGSAEQQSKLKAGQEAKSKERASAVASHLGRLTVRIPVKLGEQGRIYGSVTNKDIAEALAAQANMTVDRHKIELREPLKS